MALHHNLALIIATGVGQQKSLDFISASIIFYMDNQGLSLFDNGWVTVEELNQSEEEIQAFIGKVFPKPSFEDILKNLTV